MVAENHAGLGAQFSQVEVGQKEGLQADNQVFVGRKNVVVGELDLAVEVLAAALGAELDNIVRQVFFRFLVPMMMPYTMHAFRGCINETARKVMVFSTIVELHIPPKRTAPRGPSKRSRFATGVFSCRKSTENPQTNGETAVISSVARFVSGPIPRPCPTSHEG